MAVQQPVDVKVVDLTKPVDAEKKSLAAPSKDAPLDSHSDRSIQVATNYCTHNKELFEQSKKENKYILCHSGQAYAKADTLPEALLKMREFNARHLGMTILRAPMVDPTAISVVAHHESLIIPFGTGQYITF